MHIGIINGPNLHNIGSREPALYGKVSWQTYLEGLYRAFPHIRLSYTQSHCEGHIIEELYRLSDTQGCIGIVLNAGAYTHTSLAILDAIRAISIPVVEVHMSNIYARESYRHKSLLAEACQGQIAGFGLESYRLGIEALISSQQRTITDTSVKTQ